MTILLYAKSSGESPHEVHLNWVNGKLTVRCTCQAGLSRKLCKHRIQLLTGDVSMLNNLDQQDEMLQAVEWSKSAGITDMIVSLQKSEATLEQIQTETKRLRSAIEKHLHDGISGDET